MTEEEEELFFRIKSSFFKEIPHPKLILKAIHQLEKLGKKDKTVAHGSATDVGQISLEFILAGYLDNILQLKTRLSNSNQVDEALEILNQIYQIHWSVIIQLLHYLPSLETYSDTFIKQSEPIDFYQTRLFILNNHLTENQIKAYICAEIEDKLPEEYSVLTKTCLQCRKIVAHGGSNESVERVAG